MVKKIIEEGIFCAKCNLKMEISVIPKYEYEEGYQLHNIQAYQCPKCNKIFFTEEQAHKMEIRTQELKKSEFGFERKVTISGKSLVISIPSELVNHLNIKQGEKIKIIPVTKEGFMIKKSK